MSRDGRRRLGWLAGSAAVLVVLLAATVHLGLLPRPWPSAPPGSSPAGRQGVQHLEATVKQVAPGRNSVALAHGLLGLDVMHVRVDPETSITVGDKEGAVGDLREGRRVRVAYRLGPEGPVARSIAVVLPERDAPRSAPADVPAPLPPPAADAPAAGLEPVTAGAVARPPAPAREERAVTAPLPPPSRPAGARAGDPRRPVEILGPPKPAPETAQAPPGPAAGRPAPETPSPIARPPAEPPPSPASPETPRSAPPARPRAGDDEPDPTAVVDWLLKEYATRRR